MRYYYFCDDCHSDESNGFMQEQVEAGDINLVTVRTVKGGYDILDYGLVIGLLKGSCTLFRFMY